MRTSIGFLLSIGTFLLIGCNGDCIRGEGDPERRNFNVAPFHGIVAEGAVDVVIRRSDQQHVDVEAQPNLLAMLDTTIRDGIWTIRTSQCYKTGDDIKVYIDVPTLSHLSIQGSGDVSSEDQFDADAVTLEVAGSGDMSVIFNAMKVNASISGAGDIEVMGMCQEFTSVINGSGDIKAGDLQCARAKAEVIGSGDISLHVTDALEANVTGSGNIKYKGDPPTVNKNVTGSGKISD